MDKQPEEIKAMFSNIAPTYDRTNAAMTGSLYRNWNSKLVRLSEANPGDKILDIATGTGNLAFLFYDKLNGKAEITGIDFTQNMLNIANTRKSKGNYTGIDFLLGDALNIPFEENTFDICSIAYGVRNVESVEKCISEMCRIVKPGGKVLILETGQPKGILSILMKLYIRFIIPLIGKIFSSNESAYQYLRNSSSKFPSGDEFLKIMGESGNFEFLEFYKAGFGAINIYKGVVK